MLSSEIARTESGPRPLLRRILLFGVGIVLVGLLVFGIVRARQNTQYTLTIDRSNGRLDGKGNTAQSYTYHLEPAETAEEHTQGLSGTAQLASNEGMLFIFEEAAEQCMWMKDMGYPLDIIWVNDQKRVVHIEPDVSPRTYPRTYCHGARYVIELKAGAANKGAVKPGQQLSF